MCVITHLQYWYNKCVADVRMGHRLDLDKSENYMHTLPRQLSFNVC